MQDFSLDFVFGKRAGKLYPKNFGVNYTVFAITRNRRFWVFSSILLWVRQRGVKTIPLIPMFIYPNSFLDFFRPQYIFNIFNNQSEIIQRHQKILKGSSPEKTHLEKHKNWLPKRVHRIYFKVDFRLVLNGSKIYE